MTGDKRFQERIKRIECGKTWAPDGVIHTTRAQDEAQRRGKSRGGLSVVMLLLAPVALAFAQPDLMPDPVRAFLQAPDAETAMASLGQWDLLATIAGR